MCFIFSSLLFPTENLHYHQVVLLKGNIMVVVERGKRVCYSLPSQRQLPSGLSSKTLDCRPRPCSPPLYWWLQYYMLLWDFVLFCGNYYQQTFLGGGKPLAAGWTVQHICVGCDLITRLNNDLRSCFPCPRPRHVSHSSGTHVTFGDQRVSVRAGDGAVNLADQLHVVEQGVEGVEVGEAHHVGGAASCSLRGDPKMSLFKHRQKRTEVTNCARIYKNDFFTNTCQDDSVSEQKPLKSRVNPQGR